MRLSYTGFGHPGCDITPMGMVEMRAALGLFTASYCASMSTMHPHKLPQLDCAS